MADDSPRGLRRVLVVTGDHGLPDSTKWDGAYTDADLELHEAMRAALESLPGYEFAFLTEHAGLLERVRSDPPDLVLNFCDTGFGNDATRELHVPALLEIFGVPYSGAPPACTALCYDKALVRLVAQAHGIPTPAETYVPPDLPLDEVEAAYPALVKPARGDGSVGITRDAVVRSAAEARRQLAWLRRELPGQAALVQEYLPGTEYGLVLVGNPDAGLVAFPPLEVDYAELPEGLPPILAFESKTGPETPYKAVRPRPARLSATDVARLRRHAELLFSRLQCRDYARFDFRTGADGVVKLMDVNPNPAWSSDANMAIMAGFGGKSYPELLAMILDAAEARLAGAGPQ
jgi:D-alanine-D-alanine ligase